MEGDGTDVVKGLWESVSGEWSGDVDLDDGKLNQLYKEFNDRLAWVKFIGIGNISPEHIKEQLTKALEDNSADLAFVTSGAFCNFMVFPCVFINTCIHICILIICPYQLCVFYWIRMLA